MAKHFDQFGLENDKNSDYYLEKEYFEKEQVKGYVNGFKKANGICMPNFIRNLTTVKSLEIFNDDTFVIGYPRSGTTWIEEIVWLIINDLDFEKSKSKFHFERVRFIDSGVSKGFLNDSKRPRVFKSHLLPQFLPDDIEKKAKIVYVLRNPKDILASTFEFLKTMKEDEFTGDFETLVENFLNGKFWYGSWWNHVDQYLSMPEVFVLNYEEMLEEPLKYTKLLSNYLGKDYSNHELLKLIAFCSFENIKTYESFDLQILIDLNFFKDGLNFFRKGKIGNWRYYFSEELSKKFDREIGKKLNIKRELKYLPSNEE